MSCTRSEAVRPVHDPRGEAHQRGDRTDHVLVGGVAGVDDPVVGGEAGELGGRGVAGHRQAPRDLPERHRLQPLVEDGRCQVVVVGQRQVHGVHGEQLERLERLVLVDQQPDPGRGPGQGGRDGQQRPADGRCEAGDPQRAGRLRVRVQVEPGGLDRGQDGHRVPGQPLPGRGQPDPPAVRLDQRGAASRASAAICCDTVEVVMCNSSATARIEPSRDSSTSKRRRRVSIPLSSIKPERYVELWHVDVNPLTTTERMISIGQAVQSAPQSHRGMTNEP
jgi:hypothetical protein